MLTILKAHASNQRAYFIVHFYVGLAFSVCDCKALIVQERHSSIFYIPVRVLKVNLVI